MGTAASYLSLHGDPMTVTGGVIYGVLNVVTGKFYVGATLTLGARWKQHVNDLRANRHHSDKLQRSWNKHGENAFNFLILELCDNESELGAREQHWIDEKSAYLTGYNVCPFADHHRHSPETRAKIAQSNRTRIISAETRAKMGISASNRDPEVFARIGAHAKGKQLSSEHRAKISMGGKGKRRSPETKERMRQAALKREAQKRIKD